jgi:hypothetical protein
MIFIAPRFRGPPESGNGGYTAGLLASRIPGSVEVTLRLPPPLERSLSISETREGLELRDDETLIAEARPARVELEVPACPSFQRASQLSESYVGHQNHHFATCFVCGPERAAGDGLRIFPGAAPQRELVAAPWVADASLADERGAVRPELIWAALDCSGYFACAAPEYPVALLGRMTADVVGTIQSHERCVVIGWPLGREGRKLFAGTAVFGQDGGLRACSRQVWILLGLHGSSPTFKAGRLPSRPPPDPVGS